MRVKGEPITCTLCGEKLYSVIRVKSVKEIKKALCVSCTSSKPVNNPVKYGWK